MFLFVLYKIKVIVFSKQNKKHTEKKTDFCSRKRKTFKKTKCCELRKKHTHKNKTNKQTNKGKTEEKKHCSYFKLGFFLIGRTGYERCKYCFQISPSSDCSLDTNSSKQTNIRFFSMV
jgi:hypothetical protein